MPGNPGRGTNRDQRRIMIGGLTPVSPEVERRTADGAKMKVFQGNTGVRRVAKDARRSGEAGVSLTRKYSPTNL